MTEDDLRQLVGSLGVGAREPEAEGWEHVISKGNDDVSYRAWCDKPTVLLAHLPLALLWQLIHSDGIVFACEVRRENCPLGCVGTPGLGYPLLLCLGKGLCSYP